MDMLGALELLVTVLAVVRVTRFVVSDKLSEPMRMWFMRRFGDESKITYLVHCFWCTSIWVGAPIVAAAFILDHWVTYAVFTWLTASYAAGMLAQLDRE
jgi:hypothetical protein